MDDALMERIRERAHAIWEREGQPEGRSEEHWRQARQEVEAEAGDSKAGSRGRKGAEIVPDAEHVGKGENPIRRQIRKKASS